MTGEIAWKDGTVTKNVRVEKKNGRWLIGGESPTATTKLGGKIFVFIDKKIYWLKGNRLIAQ